MYHTATLMLAVKAEAYMNRLGGNHVVNHNLLVSRSEKMFERKSIPQDLLRGSSDEHLLISGTITISNNISDVGKAWQPTVCSRPWKLVGVKDVMPCSDDRRLILLEIRPTRVRVLFSTYRK